MLNGISHRLPPSRGTVNFILAQLYIGVNTSTTERREPALYGPNGGGIGHPFGVGLLGAKVPLEQIRSHLCVRFTCGGDRTMAGTSREEVLCSHQTTHAFARTPHPVSLELCMHARAAIHATIGLENDLHLFGKLGIFSAVLALRALAPGIIPTHRYREHPAHEDNGILRPVICHELLSTASLREKMPSAFFKRSSSCLTLSTSRLSRRISSSWAV